MPTSLPDLRHDLEREVERVADRLARLPAAGAALARNAAQTLADAAAELEALVLEAPVPARQLPDVSDAALPDVLLVVTADLVRAAGELADRESGPGRGEGLATAALAAALAQLVRLRQAL